MGVAGDTSSGTHHQTRKDINEIPKGCLVILVGRREEPKRFVIPVAHLNHPRFAELLKEAEEEFGFQQSGPIVIPCNVEEFRISSTRKTTIWGGGFKQSRVNDA